MTDQVSVKSLYAGFNRTTILFGLVLVGSWLFAAFSYYLSREIGTDCFARSGSLMCLAGAAATFRSVNAYQHALGTAFKEQLASLRAEIELTLEPTRSYQVLSYLSYATGIVGTAIWGYGDLLLPRPVY